MLLPFHIIKTLMFYSVLNYLPTKSLSEVPNPAVYVLTSGGCLLVFALPRVIVSLH